MFRIFCLIYIKYSKSNVRLYTKSQNFLNFGKFKIQNPIFYQEITLYYKIYLNLNFFQLTLINIFFNNLYHSIQFDYYIRFSPFSLIYEQNKNAENLNRLFSMYITCQTYSQQFNSLPQAQQKDYKSIQSPQKILLKRSLSLHNFQTFKASKSFQQRLPHHTKKSKSMKTSQTNQIRPHQKSFQCSIRQKSQQTSALTYQSYFNEQIRVLQIQKAPEVKAERPIKSKSMKDRLIILSRFFQSFQKCIPSFKQIWKKTLLHLSVPMKADKYIRLVYSILKLYRAFQTKNSLGNLSKQLLNARRVIQWENLFQLVKQFKTQQLSSFQVAYKTLELSGSMFDFSSFWLKLFDKNNHQIQQIGEILYTYQDDCYFYQCFIEAILLIVSVFKKLKQLYEFNKNSSSNADLQQSLLQIQQQKRKLQTKFNSFYCFFKNNQAYDSRFISNAQQLIGDRLKEKIFRKQAELSCLRQKIKELKDRKYCQEYIKNDKIFIRYSYSVQQLLQEMLGSKSQGWRYIVNGFKYFIDAFTLELLIKLTRLLIGAQCFCQDIDCVASQKK